MRKIDEKKESTFIENYVESGNAKESAIASGYSESSASSMGYYLKQKFTSEIKEKLLEKMNGVSAKAIAVLQELLDSEHDSIRLKSAQFILQANGYADNHLNVNISKDDPDNKKTDEELLQELKEIYEEHPEYLPKTLKLVN